MEALDELSLSQKWLEYGVVTEEVLLGYARESVENSTIVDHAGPYFLYGYLESKENISESQMENYLYLALNEVEEGQVHECISWLMDSKALPLDHLLSLSGAEFIKKYDLVGKYERSCVIKRIGSGRTDDKFLLECVGSGDPKVQGKILELVAVGEMVLKCLVEQGSNKRIRNIAKAKLSKIGG